VKAIYWVWRRDLAIMLRAPIVYVVGGLFLVVQGLAFAALVGQLSDPQRPAPLGALLEGQLAGTMLTWVLQLVVLTLLGMRAIADERRSGGWELLLTARVSERAAVVGKWLAAVTVYKLLWVPTLLYLAVVAWFRADGGGWDVATIFVGYAGAIALGAALLAWAVAASAATSTTLAAGALGFAALIGIFLLGELPAVAPTLAVDHPSIAHALAAVSLRGQLGSLARGELSWPPIVLIVVLAATGLSLAVALACAGRRRGREVRARFGASALVAVISILAGVIAARHPGHVDVSASRRNSLSAESYAAVEALPSRATITIVEPTLAALQPVYDEVGRVADRMAAAGPVVVRRFDPASLPGGLGAAAREAGVAEQDLAKGGGVVVEVAGRRRAVDVFDLAKIGMGPGSAPTIEQLAIEQALSGALIALADASPVRACATTGHGELSLDTPAQAGADWTAIGARLRGEGISIQSGIDASCDVVIVAGPTTPFSPDDELALQKYLIAGKALLVAAASPPGTTPPETGLEGLLAGQRISLPIALAVDPALAVRAVPGALVVTSGFAPHVVNTGFAGDRALLLQRPRVVVGGKTLVSTTPNGWGERDLDRDVAEKDPDDFAGPVTLAAEGTGHVIVVGSAESFSTAALAPGGYANAFWLTRVVRYLANKLPAAPATGTRTPDSVRLVLTDAQRTAVVATCTAGIPLLWIVLGGGFVLWRRRRAR
jgi:ABC-2 type transport system permease protein